MWTTLFRSHFGGRALQPCVGFFFWHQPLEYLRIFGGTRKVITYIYIYIYIYTHIFIYIYIYTKVFKEKGRAPQSGAPRRGDGQELDMSKLRGAPAEEDLSAAGERRTRLRVARVAFQLVKIGVFLLFFPIDFKGNLSLLVVFFQGT